MLVESEWVSQRARQGESIDRSVSRFRTHEAPRYIHVPSMDGTLIHRRIIPQVIILVATIYIDLERVCGAKLLIWETTRWQSATCMWRMWLEQKNTQRELGRSKAFVKKGSSWDTARKKENVKLNVKLYIDHKLQTCCRFILIHIHMY